VNLEFDQQTFHINFNNNIIIILGYFGHFKHFELVVFSFLATPVGFKINLGPKLAYTIVIELIAVRERFLKREISLNYTVIPK